MDENRIMDKLEELARENTAMREQIKGALRRIDEQSKLVESLRDIASSVKVMTLELTQTKERVASLAEDMETIKNKPAKRWETAATTILTVTVSAIAGYFLAKMGMK